jgi:hypothetical protein
VSFVYSRVMLDHLNDYEKDQTIGTFCFEKGRKLLTCTLDILGIVKDVFDVTSMTSKKGTPVCSTIIPFAPILLHLSL